MYVTHVTWTQILPAPVKYCYMAKTTLAIKRIMSGQVCDGQLHVTLLLGQANFKVLPIAKQPHLLSHAIEYCLHRHFFM